MKKQPSTNAWALVGAGYAIGLIMDNALHAPLWLIIAVCGMIGAGWAILTHSPN